MVYVIQQLKLEQDEMKSWERESGCWMQWGSKLCPSPQTLSCAASWVYVYMNSSGYFYVCMHCAIIFYIIKKDFLSIMQQARWCMCDTAVASAAGLSDRDWREPIILPQTRQERRHRAAEQAWDTHVAQD